MFTRSFRPLSRNFAARVGAATASGATAVVGYACLEQNRVHNDASGVRNWDASKGQYDEDLKRNRHKGELVARWLRRLSELVMLTLSHVFFNRGL